MNEHQQQQLERTREYVEQLRREHPLRDLFWECTLRCNMACRHCGSDCLKESMVPDMPLADFLPVLDEVAAHCDPREVMVQTVIDVGSQVNEALADCQAAVEKHDYYHRQVEVLKDAYKGTHELMDNGKASYLEVLTAQESLLNAQLNEAVNMYNGAQGIIALYIALGGATR